MRTILQRPGITKVTVTLLTSAEPMASPSPSSTLATCLRLNPVLVDSPARISDFDAGFPAVAFLATGLSLDQVTTNYLDTAVKKIRKSMPISQSSKWQK